MTSDLTDNARYGPRLQGASAGLASAPALFAPLAGMALAAEGAPLWSVAIAIGGAAPLVTLGALGLARPTSALGFAGGAWALSLAAAVLAWMTGGALSAAAPWIFAGLAATAVLGGGLGAIVAVATIALIGAVAAIAPEPPARLMSFAPREERAATAAISWAMASVTIIAVAAAASRAWSAAAPPTGRPAVAAQKALSMLAGAAAICAIRVTRENAIAQVFGAPERTLEFERDELRSLSLDALAHPDDLPALEGLRSAVLAQETPEPITVRLHSRLGGFRWLEATAAPSDEFPAAKFAAAAADDVVIIFRERWRRDGGATAFSTTEQAGFLAHVGGNLRASLKSIVGFTDILRNELFGPLGAERYRDYARLAHQGGLTLIDRVEELLDLAEMEAGRYAAKTDDVPVSPLIDGAIRILQARGEAAGIGIEADIAPSVDKIRIDRRALRRVVLSMMIDAVRRVHVGDKVIVETAIEDQAIRFTVHARVVATGSIAQPAEIGDDALPNRRDGQTALAAEELDRLASEARLGRLVAANLAELMGGTLFFLDLEDDSAAPLPPGDTLIAEAILPIAPEDELSPPAPIDPFAAVRGEAAAPAALSAQSAALAAPGARPLAPPAALAAQDHPAQDALFKDAELPQTSADAAPPEPAPAALPRDAAERVEPPISSLPEPAGDAAPMAPGKTSDEDLPLFDLDGDESDQTAASWDDAEGGGGRIRLRLRRRLPA